MIGLGLTLAACTSSHDVNSAGPSPTTSISPAAQAVAGVVASAGCQRGPTAKVTNNSQRLDVSGSTRDYLLTTPPPHPQPVPLVVDFHGYGEGATTESLTTQFGALGQQKGFVVVFPNGTGNPIAWNTSTKPGNPDVRFVTHLLAHLEATQCIDEARVYATGLSQGASCPRRWPACCHSGLPRSHRCQECR